MYANESLGFDFDNTVYALDSTTIDLCLSVFPGARFRARKAAIEAHTQLDPRGAIPAFPEVSDGKQDDVNILESNTPERASFCVHGGEADRGLAVRDAAAEAAPRNGDDVRRRRARRGGPV